MASQAISRKLRLRGTAAGITVAVLGGVAVALGASETTPQRPSAGAAAAPPGRSVAYVITERKEIGRAHV